MISFLRKIEEQCIRACDWLLNPKYVKKIKKRDFL